jgi:hypothetical protein
MTLRVTEALSLPLQDKAVVLQDDYNVAIVAIAAIVDLFLVFTSVDFIIVL